MADGISVEADVAARALEELKRDGAFDCEPYFEYIMNNDDLFYDEPQQWRPRSSVCNWDCSEECCGYCNALVIEVELPVFISDESLLHWGIQRTAAVHEMYLIGSNNVQMFSSNQYNPFVSFLDANSTSYLRGVERTQWLSTSVYSIELMVWLLRKMTKRRLQKSKLWILDWAQIVILNCLEIFFKMMKNTTNLRSILARLVSLSLNRSLMHS